MLKCSSHVEMYLTNYESCFYTLIYQMYFYSYKNEGLEHWGHKFLRTFIDKIMSHCISHNEWVACN